MTYLHIRYQLITNTNLQTETESAYQTEVMVSYGDSYISRILNLFLDKCGALMTCSKYSNRVSYHKNARSHSYTKGRKEDCQQNIYLKLFADFIMRNVEIVEGT